MLQEYNPATLLLFCVDSIRVIDRTTFLSMDLQGLNVTYWKEESSFSEETLSNMYRILFEEVERRRSQITNN